MTEPFVDVWVAVIILLQAICLLGLLYGAVRFRRWLLFLLAVTLVGWPLAGQGLNLWAKALVRDPQRPVPIGMTPGEFVATVAWVVISVQTLLNLAVTVLCLYRVWRQRAADTQAHEAPSVRQE